MNNSLFYETPMAELILVRFEENILSGGGPANSGAKFEEDATVVDRSGENWW